MSQISATPHLSRPLKDGSDRVNSMKIDINMKPEHNYRADHNFLPFDGRSLLSILGLSKPCSRLT